MGTPLSVLIGMRLWGLIFPGFIQGIDNFRKFGQVVVFFLPG